MNIFSQFKILPNLLMNNYSSAFLASDSFISSLLSADNIFTRIIRFVLQLLYFACKWIMYIVDVIYFYVMQLAGVTVDTSIFDSMSTDFTLKLLIDNKDLVTKIVKNFIVIAIIIMLVTAIIAIIKQQAAAMKEGQANGSPAKKAMQNVLKSIMLMILTPIMALLGILASSVLLQGLFRATSLSESKSISSTVFEAAASSANKYRAYADSGVRIPIVYKFSGQKKSDAVTYAVNMIGKDAFPSFNYFDPKEEYKGPFQDPVYKNSKKHVIEESNGKSGRDIWLEQYYSYFDSSTSYKENSSINQYRCIKTIADEYYVMADVISYALETMEEFYFITVQEWLESVAAVESNLDATLDIIKKTDETIKLSGVNNLTKRIVVNGDYAYISYETTYASGEKYDYYHIKNSLDEIEGAKFIIAYKTEGEQIDDDDTEKTKSIYGELIEDGSNYKDAETFYLKDNSSYKKVDLFYCINANSGEFLKVAEDDFKLQDLKDGKYYYLIGADYYKIDAENQEFYYKVDSDYKLLDLKTVISDDTKVQNNDFEELRIFYTSVKKTYYMPLTNGVSVDGISTFSSDYLKSGLITARGVFDKAGYPTAIRKTSGGKILFYRDDLQMVADGEAGDFATIDQIEAEEDAEEEEETGGEEGETKENQSFFSKAVSTVKTTWSSVKNFFSDLFNPLKLVPDLKIDDSKVQTSYTKKTTLVTSLSASKLHISYFFSDSLTSKITSKNKVMNINYLFEPMNINYVVLVIGSIALFKIMTTAIFALVNRALNIFLLILIYPVACSTIPLEEAEDPSKATTYPKWRKKFMQLLFSTYGLILSLNFVFIIISVLNKIEFFTPEDIAQNAYFARIANALRNPWMLFGGKSVYAPNYKLTCRFINKLLRIIFEIAAFSLVSSINGKKVEGSFNDVIQAVVGMGPGALEDSPIDAVKKTLKSATKAVNTVLFPAKAIKDQVSKSFKKVKSVAKDFVPGSAVAKEAIDKAKQIGTKLNNPVAIGMQMAEKMKKELPKNQNNPPKPPPK